MGGSYSSYNELIIYYLLVLLLLSSLTAQYHYSIQCRRTTYTPSTILYATQHSLPSGLVYVGVNKYLNFSFKQQYNGESHQNLLCTYGYGDEALIRDKQTDRQTVGRTDCQLQTGEDDESLVRMDYSGWCRRCSVERSGTCSVGQLNIE